MKSQKGGELPPHGGSHGYLLSVTTGTNIKNTLILVIRCKVGMPKTDCIPETLRKICWYCYFGKSKTWKRNFTFNLKLCGPGESMIQDPKCELTGKMSALKESMVL